MKKILLLSITSLALLRADFTLTGTQLTPLNEPAGETTPPIVEPTTPPATTDPVNTSGIIPNNTDMIWADMHDAPTGYPVATNSGYGQFRGPVFNGRLNTEAVGWEKTNAWFEVEEATRDNVSCGYIAGTSTNTIIESTPMTMAWREGNTWKVAQDGTGTLGGTTHPTEGMLFTGNRGCNVTNIENIRTDYKGYNVHVGAKGINQLYEPKHYYRYHGWAKGSPRTDRTTITAVYAGQYVRLVLKDPNGVDDRHLARFVIHVASDMKAADGTQIPGYAGWTVSGGISRFKMIPTNGDWMPINFLDGWITKEDLDANPPPFAKLP